MRFSKIELCGFKSFANKTCIDFSSGITAILGPNGCGKSNIVDAVKWVLGEQKAKSLRGSEMSDVIFSGSVNRKSMGMAEVNLYFDNSDGSLSIDFNEVCVSRRLYRSGESEYLINKKACRLRDVRDLFMDTGIGTSAYSFIEQGKVEALLAAKPQERRIVFEEAAGISKYKARRKETLARLDRTGQYLLRVNDIIEELEKRIRSISRQAQGARRYQRLNAELLETKSLLYRLRWQNEREHIAKFESQILELQELKQREEAQQVLLDGEIGQQQSQELEMECRLKKHTAALNELQQKISQTETEKARSSERQTGLINEGRISEEQIDSLGLRITALEAQHEELKTEQLELEEATRRVGSEVSSVEIDCKASQNRSTLLEEQLEEQRQTANANLTQKNASDSAIELIAHNEAELQQRLKQLTERLQAYASTSELQRKEISRLHDQEKLLQNAEAEQRDQLANLRHEADRRQNEIEDEDKKISSFQNNYSAKSSRLGTIKELDANLSGFYRGVKSVLKARKNERPECHDVCGVIADILQVEPKVSLAIETALGSAQQYLITKTAQGAKQAIEFLKQEKSGKATFLPLDSLTIRQGLGDELLEMQGVVGVAINLVKYPAQYTLAMKYLLNNILIVDNIEHALNLRRNQAKGIRMVTLEGDLISQSGAMTGGREHNQRGGLLTRKSEIEQLTHELEKLTEELQNARNQRLELQEVLAKIKEKLQQGEGFLQIANQRSRDNENKLTAVTAKEAGIKTEITTGERDKAFLSQKTQELCQQKEEQNKLQEMLVLRQIKFEEECKLSQQQLVNARKDADSENSILLTLKIMLAEKTQRLQDVNKTYIEQNNVIEQIYNDINKHKKRLTETRSEQNELQTKLEQLNKSMHELSGNYAKNENQLQEMHSTLTLFKGDLDAKRQESRVVTRRVAEISESVNTLQLKAKESQLRNESIAEKVREELKLDSFADLLDAIKNKSFAADDAAGAEVTDHENNLEMENYPENDEEYEPEEELDEDELSHQIDDLQERLHRIGPVNHQAIAELAELKARREFLLSEHEDLDAANKHLLDLVQKINNECRQRFDQTFKAVKENFQVLFRRLFGGGKAELILEENDDPLNAGIEIYAKPPGKEPTSISLLSGGEKALCAVALLFSIFRSKPSPFCILDEVDGPLDESNIDRYMEAVREFSQDSQFIIITHSKRTMSMTDIIYGITQSEPGISKKMSLRFDKESKDTVAQSVA